MIYIEHYLYLFKQHNRPWSDMEKGIFIMIMAFTVAMCFIAVLRKKINILKAIKHIATVNAMIMINIPFSISDHGRLCCLNKYK